ncbi:MAG: hypothetical protein HY699_02560 [Deltaproteobacteria bacterium]|nr:hypothetical protein [Deltaproteobacteria bacterium]
MKKMYDKAGSIILVETTMGNPKDFCVLRPRREDERGERHGDVSGAHLPQLRRAAASAGTPAPRPP